MKTFTTYAYQYVRRETKEEFHIFGTSSSELNSLSHRKQCGTDSSRSSYPLLVTIWPDQSGISRENRRKDVWRWGGGLSLVTKQALLYGKEHRSHTVKFGPLTRELGSAVMCQPHSIKRLISISRTSRTHWLTLPTEVFLKFVTSEDLKPCDLRISTIHSEAHPVSIFRCPANGSSR
jgi:hypothetical protein